MTAAGIVLGPMGVLMPPRAWRHTEPITVGMPAIEDCFGRVTSTNVHSLQWVMSAAGMELAFGGKVAPERAWPQTEPTTKGSVMNGLGLAHHPSISLSPKGRGCVIVALGDGGMLW